MTSKLKIVSYWTITEIGLITKKSVFSDGKCRSKKRPSDIAKEGRKKQKVTTDFPTDGYSVGNSTDIPSELWKRGFFSCSNFLHFNIVSFFRCYIFAEFAKVENVGAGHSNAQLPW